jgi:hypothetical protein
MKIVARIREPEKITARFKEVVLSKADRYDEGYEDGEKAGYSEGYAEGEKHGADVTSSFYDDRISAELAEVNDVIQTHGDSKAETLEQISKAVSTTIGAASMKAQTVGYAQGVDDTNAQRDAKDAAYLNDINEVLQDYGRVADDLGSVDETFRESIEINMEFKYGIGYANGTKDANEERDAVDASRLAEINTALTANGGTAAETLDGVDEKIPEVHTAGVKSEYDRFWDAYQVNGTATNYNGAFSGARWNDDTFTPKYDIVPSAAQSMFWSSGINDLVGALEKHGVKLDFSKCNSFAQTFAYSKMPEIGEVYAIGKYLSATFSNTTYLHTIQKIRVNANTTYNAAFSSATALENITFEGTIAQSGLNFQWSTKLSRASIENIIATLSATASGKSITLSKVAVNTAFETSAGAADGSTSDAWKTLIGTKTNWTISLV